VQAKVELCHQVSTKEVMNLSKIFLLHLQTQFVGNKWLFKSTNIQVVYKGQEYLKRDRRSLLNNSAVQRFLFCKHSITKNVGRKHMKMEYSEKRNLKLNLYSSAITEILDRN